MAVFRTSYVLIIMSIIFVSAIPSSTSHKITVYEIKRLCTKTTDVKPCYTLFNQDLPPRELVKRYLDFAIEKAYKIEYVFDIYAREALDYEFRHRYVTCSKNYIDAIHHLQDAKKKLKPAGASINIHVHLNNASKEIRSCDKMLDSRSSEERSYNEDFQSRIYIAEVLSDNLK